MDPPNKGYRPFCYNNADPLVNETQGSPTLGVAKISGTPASANVIWTEWDPSIQATEIPPNADQPGTALLATNEDRLLATIWKNGTLWTAGNDRCQPAGDPSMRACARLIEVDTTSGCPVVLKDFDTGLTGGHVYFPAISLDRLGNLFVVFTESSTTKFASLAEASQLADEPARQMGSRAGVLAML